MVARNRSSRLPYTRWLIAILLIAVSTITLSAQGNRNITVELATATFDGEALLHLRVPRGQTIEVATLSQNDLSITLEADVLPLEKTQFILLDASDEMVNLQPVVQANMPRFWQSSEQDTSLIFFDNQARVLQATSRTEDIDDFLSDYTINPGAPACLSEALTTVNNLERDLERSWRILLVTVGDFSRSSSCDRQTLQTAPAPIDVIAITAEIDEQLIDLIDRSGGQFYTANLRSIEARTNEVVTQWGQPTFAVRGDIPDGWDNALPFDLDIELSNGTEETLTLSFADYNVPIPPTPTPQPTETNIPTSEPEIVAEATEDIAQVAPTAVSNDTETSASEIPSDVNNVFAVLLIIGAVLFVIGAIVLALALARFRRSNQDDEPPPMSAGNFYDSLDAPQPEIPSYQTSTRIREKGIVSSEFDEPQTQIAPLDDTLMDEFEGDDDDDLLVTRVLTDNRFQSMMEQSENNDEVVGWLRLLISRPQEEIQEDYELTRRGAVIGRSLECDIQITGDRAISRKHARLDVRSNNQVTVTRLSAVNPVVVGGVQITNRHPLKTNDVIHLSDETRLIFIAQQYDGINIDDTQID